MHTPATMAAKCSTAATARFSGMVTSLGWVKATNSVRGSFQPLQAKSEPDPSQPRVSRSP